MDELVFFQPTQMGINSVAVPRSIKLVSRIYNVMSLLRERLKRMGVDVTSRARINGILISGVMVCIRDSFLSQKLTLVEMDSG